MTTNIEEVLYFYAIIPRGQDLPKASNVELQPIPSRSLVALVEFVSAHEFSPDAIEKQLQSIEWVAPLARKHETVLEAAMQKGPLIPAGLCTLFSSVEAVQAYLADHEETLLNLLKRLHDRQEWGIKVFCDMRQLEALIGSTDPGIQSLSVTAATASAGRAYVIRKQCETRIAELATERIDENVDEILEVLDPLLIESRIKPLVSDQVGVPGPTAVLNMTVLIVVTDLKRLTTVIQELASRFDREGFVFKLSGPWPPYSFANGVGGNLGDS